MNTLKSAAVVVVLLVVLYGVYVALNKPDFFSTPSVSNEAPPVVEFGPADPGPPHTVSPAHAAGQVSPFDPAAAANRSIPGGSFQPSTDASSLPPPTTIPSNAPPLDPTAGAGSGLQRSSYETPAGPSKSAPPLDPPALAPPSAATPAAPGSSATLTAYSLKRDWQEAEQAIAAGKFKAALAKLSPYYGNPDLTPQDRGQLLAWLDALAGKVIYSREHLLDMPYRAGRGETLFQIADKYNVSYLILANINRPVVSDPLVIVPGTELKIVPGPFRAEANLTTSELTLFLGELYAGRFPFTLGDQPPQPGTYRVMEKQRERTYYGLDGRVIPANDPSNPYGGYWLSLGGEVAIHGSPLSPATGASTKPLGCLSLSPQDAADVNSILGLGSDVVIRR